MRSDSSCLVCFLRTFFILCAVSLTAPPPARAQTPALVTRLDEVVQAPDYRQAQWGLLVVDRVSGAVIHEHNADKLFAPASTTKLFTVAAALDEFGPDHRFTTSVYRTGEVNANGELEGNLVLVPGGDLTLGGRTDASGRIAFVDVDHTYADFTVATGWTAPDPLAGLRALATQVASRGIRRLTGDVVVDERLFDPAEGTGSGPSRLTPIVVNDNVVDFLITPTKAGSPASVVWRPQTPLIVVDAQIETAAPGTEAAVRVLAPEPGRVVLRGRIAEGGKPLIKIYAVPDPASFARSLFVAELARAGVFMAASALGNNRRELLPADRSLADERRVASLDSPPFREEARLILKVSHNLHASILPMLVAVQHGRRTLADGLRLQHDFLARAGVDVDTISFGGGAGGARSDFVTPRATVQLLRYMSSRSDFAAYENALPVLGVDGTLATISTNSPARGKLRAKTGTLLWENTMNGGFLLTSKALAGYLTTSRQREVVVAMFVNQVHLKRSSESAKVGAALGRVCEILHEDL